MQRLVDVHAETAGCPTHMGFQNLAHIHPRRHAERVQHDVDGRAFAEERHVLDRHHLGHNALVAVTSGHLVARLQLALHRDEHLDHLHHTRGQIVATADLFDLVLKTGIQGTLLRLVLLVQGFDDLGVILIGQRQLPP